MPRRAAFKRRRGANLGAWTAIAAGVAVAIFGATGLARRQAPRPDHRLLIELAPASRGERLGVTSAAIGAGDRISPRNTSYGANFSPALSWTGAVGARAWAVALEDPDAPTPEPFVHWLMWNIPPGVTRLGEGRTPAGAVLGRNGAGRIGYWGPRPPSGVHHYHFEVFALSVPLPLPAGAGRDALAAALRGHVIASGQTVGLASPP